MDTNDVTAKDVQTTPPKFQQLYYHDLFFRILTLLLTFVAVVVVAVDKQTKIVSISLSDSLPPMQIPVTAKWHYLSSNVYFLVSNAIAFLYIAGSLIHAMAIRAQKHKENVVIIILDVVMMGLLFSANGAVAGVGIIGQYGNSHSHWTRVCNVVGRFCHDMAAALAASLLASLVLLWMVVIAIFNLVNLRRPEQESIPAAHDRSGMPCDHSSRAICSSRDRRWR